MNILITGGAGFIGGHLAETFAAAGHDVTVLDNLDRFYDLRVKKYTINQCRDVARESTGTYTFQKGDIRNTDTVQKVMQNVEVVYHQAAQAGVRPSVENPREYNAVNVDGTLNVLDAARSADVERVVYASSSSVYGKPQYLPYDEQHPTTPVSPYGASKLSGERYTLAYNHVYDLPTVALRYFTVYGPRMRPNMAISNFVSRCINGQSPVIYGDGSQTRDFTYIADVVEANQSLLTTDAGDGQVMNIGSTDNISIAELATEIRATINPQIELEYDDRHAADADHTHADTSKANRLLDYKPTYLIREGVSEFVNWYQNNRDWYETVMLSDQSRNQSTLKPA